MSVREAAAFFATGGAVPLQSPSYCVRAADEELYASLLRGEYCYILASRQIGKTSLTARTAARLRDDGLDVAYLDLTEVGVDCTREQWYYTLLTRTAADLGLRNELRKSWTSDSRLSLLQRWTDGLRLILKARPAHRLAVFVDEIDYVRNLAFDTSEFFAAMRSCYNRRTTETEFCRLTFCLIGVATPSDLIEEVDVTPFNIGRRIELVDFSEEEAAHLAHGFQCERSIGRALLNRALFWTGGQPYLTQRLCQEIALRPGTRSAAHVDSLCVDLFLAPEAQEQDTNLTFVRDRMLMSGADTADLLSLYTRVYREQPVLTSSTGQLIDVLMLSGLVRSMHGRLLVRNRIYQNVFDSAWIREHMPGADLRRQRAAYRRGVFRASIVVSLALAAIGALCAVAGLQYFHSQEIARQYELVRQYHYLHEIDLAQSGLVTINLPSALKALESVRPAKGESDPRGFEWRYLWQRLHGESVPLPCFDISVFAVAVSPDGRFVAAAGQPKHHNTSHIHMWDIVTRREMAPFAFSGEVNGLVFSPDGKKLAAAGGVASDSPQPGNVHLWDLRAPSNPPTVLRAFQQSVRSVTFSRDSRQLCIASDHGDLCWWDIATSARVNVPRRMTSVGALALSPDSKILIYGGDKVFVTYLSSRKAVHRLTLPYDYVVYALQFSPDGRLLSMANRDGTVLLWDVKTWSITRTFRCPATAFSVAFSPDSTTVAAACWDATIRLWDVKSGRELRPLRGHFDRVNSVAFAPIGRTLISGANDGTVRLWDVDPATAPVNAVTTTGPVCGVAISGSTIVATSDGTQEVRLWNANSGRALGTLSTANGTNGRLHFGPDGRMLVSAQWDQWIRPKADTFDRRSRISVFGDTSNSATRTLPATMEDLVTHSRLGGTTEAISDVRGAALSPHGDILAIIGPDREHSEYSDGTVELWSTATRQLLGAIRGAHQNDITALAFSPDGKTLATGGWDKMVRLWQVDHIHGIQDGRGRSTAIASQLLNTFSAEVYATAFTSDGKTLAVGTKDGRISLCSLVTREVVLVLSGHLKAVTSLAFSSDDNLLVSGSTDGTVRFWRAAPFSRTDAPERVALDAMLKR